ncbi:MAG: carbohydrate ABC transporter permease [Phycisphaerae bacterium]|nr:carbohydrate ABC transporter permease [Phycisphaerae bacterium]
MSGRPGFAARLAAHALVYGAAVSMAVPLAWMVITSLKTDAEALGHGAGWLPASPRWENYARAWASAELGRFYVNSLVVAGVTTALGVAHNALAGFAFAWLPFRGRGVMFGLALATMMLPAQVSFIFAYILAQRLGYVDSLAGLIVPFLASGFGIYFMREAAAGVPRALIDSGRVDGMGPLELFWNVVAPNVRPALAALAIITFVNSWNAFFWPLVLVDSRRHNTLPLAIAELSAAIYVRSWPERMAAGTILTLPLVAVFLVFQRAIVRGMASAGLKEA